MGQPAKYEVTLFGGVADGAVVTVQSFSCDIDVPAWAGHMRYHRVSDNRAEFAFITRPA